LRHRNERLIESAPSKKQAKLRKLHGLLIKFDDLACKAGDTIDPNTGWGPIWAALNVRAESAFCYACGPKPKLRAKPAVVSDVAKLITALEKANDWASQDENPETDKRAHRMVRELSDLYRQIVPLVAATTGRVGSDFLLDFCKLTVRTIREEDYQLVQSDNWNF
jgi:hypothetical protein